MKSGRPILLAAAAAAAFLSLPQPASAQWYGDQSCPPNAGPYGYYGDGYGYDPYYANPPRRYAPRGGYGGYPPYSGYGPYDRYGSYSGYGDPYAYDRYGYGRSYPYRYSTGRRHRSGDRYGTPYGRRGHHGRRLDLFPLPHFDRRSRHH